MKKLYIAALFLLVGCAINNIQAAGRGFVKHYEDQLADNEMTIDEYMIALEERADRSEWKSAARKLEDMRIANDGRYHRIVSRLMRPLERYRKGQINRVGFQKQVRDTIDQVYRNQ